MVGILTKLVALGLAVASALGVGAILRDNFPPLDKPQVTSSQRAPAALGAVDADPIGPCGPGINSKQYVTVRRSECSGYTDCQLNNGSWKLITQTECNAIQGRVGSSAKVDCIGPDGKHLQVTQEECNNFNNAWGNKPGQQNTAQNNTSSQTSLIDCTVNGSTWKDTPSQCSYWQWVAADVLRRANQTIQNLPPLTVPTFGPVPTYGPIPDIAGAAKAEMDKSIQKLQDSQKMVLPTPTPVPPAPCGGLICSGGNYFNY